MANVFVAARRRTSLQICSHYPGFPLGARLADTSTLKLFTSLIMDYMRTTLSSGGIRSSVLRLCRGPGPAPRLKVGW